MAETGRYRDALRGRDARLLTTAFVVDLIGGWAYAVVLMVEVFDRTGSTLAVSLAAISSWLPRLVLGPLGGLAADRFERTVVMRVSSLAAGVLMAALCAVVALGGPVPLMLALSFSVSLTLTAYSPAAGAMRTAVVEEKDLIAINAVFSALESLAVVVGPLIGALALAVGQPAFAFGLNAASFFVGAALVGAMRTRSTGSVEDDDQSFVRQLSAGVTAVWGEPVARALVLLIALDSAVYGASTVVFIPLGVHLGAGSDGLTLLIAAFALGGVLVSAVVNRLAAGTRLAPVVLGGMVLLVVPFSAAVLTQQLWLGLLLQVLAGAGMVAVDVLGITVLQRDVARGVLGRVLAIVDTIALLGIMLGSLAMVPLLSAGGLSLALGTLLAVVLVGTVLCLRPLLRADRANAEQVALLRPRVQLLEALDLLAGAPHPLLERLAAACEVVVGEKGVVLMRQGERADALWVVVSGAVQVVRRGPTGKETVSVVLGAHSYVGELGLLHGIPRTATVTVVDDALLWRIPAEEFRAALAEGAPSASFRSVAGSRVRQLSSALRPPEPRRADATAPEPVEVAPAEPPKRVETYL